MTVREAEAAPSGKAWISGRFGAGDGPGFCPQRVALRRRILADGSPIEALRLGRLERLAVKSLPLRNMIAEFYRF